MMKINKLHEILVVSAGFGLIFVFLPAYKESRMNPIESLRFEM